MFPLWAVARHTFKQCLRMKIAGLFMLLLAVTLVALPFGMKGDGTLAGQIRSFLSYGPGLTAMVLSLMTVFLSAGMISSDIRDKQIFSVATKPVPRWQYIFGRWLGLLLLNAMLLSAASVGIYGMTRYLRTRPSLHSEDRRAVETEVFAARQAFAPAPLDLQANLDRRIKELRESGRLKAALEAYLAETDGDMRLAMKLLNAELESQVSTEIQSVGPNASMAWSFTGIDVEGSETHGSGEVQQIIPERGLVTILASKEIVGKLVHAGPVSINGIDGKVIGRGADRFGVQFPIDDMKSSPISTLTTGKKVEVLAYPTIQLTYKAIASGVYKGDPVPSYWKISNPQTGLVFAERRNDRNETRATITLSARLVSDDGRLEVKYVNLPYPSGEGQSVTILTRDVAVLYSVANFDGKFFRGMGLILAQLSFLGALGVTAGSLFSFPVACLTCFAMLPFQMGRQFLNDSVLIHQGASGVTRYLSQYLVRLMNLLLPDFSATSPVEFFVGGMNISWQYLGETYFETMLVQTVVLLIVACLLFGRRELARVQV